jgi:hypothetical protein
MVVEPAEVGIRGDHSARVKSRVYGSSELDGEKLAGNTNNSGKEGGSKGRSTRGTYTSGGMQA